MTNLPPSHPSVLKPKIGVVLMNLGTPEATDYFSMRRYLKEFLSDRRVIEVPKIIWWFILNLIILTFRPTKSGKNYALIWNKEKNESPLKTFTRAQAEGLIARLNSQDIIVEWCMRYGKPDVDSTIKRLQLQGCQKLLIVPLYPQYAASTTATACDQVFRTLMKMRWQPTIRVAAPYYDEPIYIEKVAQSITEELAKLSFTPQKILVSFHGVPKQYLVKGDPYHCQAVKSGRLIREKLGFTPEQMSTTFQSRFGKAEWLKPYTDETVMALGKAGVKSLAIVAPGFSSDCIETLEELNGENRHYFEENGGENFAYIPCLNASELGLDVIEAVVRKELQGWV